MSEQNPVPESLITHFENKITAPTFLHPLFHPQVGEARQMALLRQDRLTPKVNLEKPISIPKVAESSITPQNIEPIVTPEMQSPKLLVKSTPEVELPKEPELIAIEQQADKIVAIANLNDNKSILHSEFMADQNQEVLENLSQYYKLLERYNEFKENVSSGLDLSIDNRNLSKQEIGFEQLNQLKVLLKQVNITFEKFIHILEKERNIFLTLSKDINTETAVKARNSNSDNICRLLLNTNNIEFIEFYLSLFPIGVDCSKFVNEGKAIYDGSDKNNFLDFQNYQNDPFDYFPIRSSRDNELTKFGFNFMHNSQIKKTNFKIHLKNLPKSVRIQFPIKVSARLLF
jgi:hypothetical protein